MLLGEEFLIFSGSEMGAKVTDQRVFRGRGFLCAPFFPFEGLKAAEPEHLNALQSL